MDSATENRVTEAKEAERQVWVPPRIRTYTPEELLQEMGPAQACTPYSPPGSKPGEPPPR
ncbi:MAG: hypothetical protein KA419_12215 [Acidobacteria bacterium]|nr:hypothetical protein [Acidobacteriota bacterium]